MVSLEAMVWVVTEISGGGDQGHSDLYLLEANLGGCYGGIWIRSGQLGSSYIWGMGWTLSDIIYQSIT